jgi:hypothetical protein
MNYFQLTEPDQKQSLCLICQIEFNETPTSNLSKIIDCSHIYHTQCIEKWFEYNESCPICRKKLSETTEPNLLQFILLFLSLQQSPPLFPENDVSLHTYETQALSNTAFTCVFLSILLERYATAAEYNKYKQHALQLKSSLSVENEIIPTNVNISSRTSIIREIKHRQILMRCQLLQWLWTSSDPYHLQEPPQLSHGRALYQHPYLQSWRRKIELAIDSFGH